jgi:hypothetical protein
MGDLQTRRTTLSRVQLTSKMGSIKDLRLNPGRNAAI